MKGPPRALRKSGFTLLPVVLAMSLVAAIAFLLNRDNGVNAAMIADQYNTDRARLAAEAGLQAANYVVQQKGCAGGFPTSLAPVTNADFGGAAYSAYADRASGSPLNLSATGTYNGASVALARSNVYVYQSPVKSYTLQPGPAAMRDTSLSFKKSNENFGGSTVMQLASNSPADPGNFEPLLQFDFSMFPAGSRVVLTNNILTGQLQPGAQLGLFSTTIAAASARVINAQFVTQSWVEGTKTGGGAPDGATWNTYDGANAWPATPYASTPLSSAAYTGILGWANWDITDAVIAWMAGLYPNYGVWLHPSGPGIGGTRYVSSDEILLFLFRPKVDLTYLLPCGASAPP